MFFDCNHNSHVPFIFHAQSWVNHPDTPAFELNDRSVAHLQGPSGGVRDLDRVPIFFYQIRFVCGHNDGNKLLFELKSSNSSLELIFFGTRLQLSAQCIK